MNAKENEKDDDRTDPRGSAEYKAMAADLLTQFERWRDTVGIVPPQLIRELLVLHRDDSLRKAGIAVSQIGLYWWIDCAQVSTAIKARMTGPAPTDASAGSEAGQ